MILPKYYCERCKQFRSKKETIKAWCGYRSYKLLCNKCLERVMDSKLSLETVMRDYYTWLDAKKEKDLKTFLELSGHHK